MYRDSLYCHLCVKTEWEDFLFMVPRKLDFQTTLRHVCQLKIWWELTSISLGQHTIIDSGQICHEIWANTIWRIFDGTDNYKLSMSSSKLSVIVDIVTVFVICKQLCWYFSAIEIHKKVLSIQFIKRLWFVATLVSLNAGNFS